MGMVVPNMIKHLKSSRQTWQP